MVSGIALVQDGGGEADGGTGVLGLALEHQVRVVDLGELAADSVAVRLSGDHQHAVCRRAAPAGHRWRAAGCCPNPVRS